MKDNERATKILSGILQNIYKDFGKDLSNEEIYSLECDCESVVEFIIEAVKEENQ